MTQQLTSSSHDILQDSNRLIAVLERYRAELPFVDEELACHQALNHELSVHQRISADTLAEWRQALAQRWECEVAGQRLYLDIQRRLCDFFGGNSPHVQILAPSNTVHARTAAELLAELRRVEASLQLLYPQPTFVPELLALVARVADDLDNALAWTQRCEDRRHSALLEQRLTCHAYERARNQTQRRLNQYLGDDYALMELSEISL